MVSKLTFYHAQGKFNGQQFDYIFSGNRVLQLVQNVS